MRPLGWFLVCALAGCGTRASESMPMAASAKASAPAATMDSPSPNPQARAATATAEFGGERHPSKAAAPQALDPHGERERGSDKPSILAAVASPLKGEVTDADLRAAVDAKADAMSRCLNADTVIEASLKILPSGDITDVTITKILPDESIARDCVASTLRSARVQNVRGGESTAVSIKLVLKKAFR